MVRGRRTAKLFGCVIGTVFHQGGTISTILAGSTVKPVCDEAKVSHEELSYIVDSTASPIATVIPFNVWPYYVAGLVVGTIPLFTTDAEAISFFYRAILFNFYGIIAVVFTYTFALDLNPFVFGKMKRAIERVKTTGGMSVKDSHLFRTSIDEKASGTPIRCSCTSMAWASRSPWTRPGPR